MHNDLNNGYNPQKFNNKQENPKIPEQGNFSDSPKTNNEQPRNNSSNLGQTNRGNNLKNNLNQQNKIDQAKQELVKEGAKAAATAFGGAAGGAAVDALAKTKLGQKALKTASNNLSPKKFSPFGFFKKKNEEEDEELSGTATGDIGKKVIGFSAFGTFFISGCFSVIIILVIIAIIISPLHYINELVSSAGSALSDFGEKLGNFLTFRGWCSDEECQEIEENNFYEHIDEVYEEYLQEKNVRLNVSLLTATLTYAEPFTTLDDEEITSIEDLAPSNYINFRKSDKKVDELAVKMVSHCCYENGSEYMAPNGEHMCQGSDGKDYDDIDYECPEDVYKEIDGEQVLVTEYTERYKLDVERYEQYLREDFVKKFYFDDKDLPSVGLKVDDAVDEIFLRVAMYDNLTGQGSYTRVYGHCSGVTVVDDDGEIIGTYDLEDYVASIISEETYSGQSMEAYKALAVAIRTLTLSTTDNCSQPVSNANYDEDYQDYAKEAAQATDGQILLYNDRIFASEYDSFCNNSSCNYGTENGQRYADYIKLPNEEQHRVYLSSEYYDMIDGGSGRGLSIVASYQLADEGMTYSEILEYFYSPGVMVSNMITVNGNSYISTSTAPNTVAEVQERAAYYAAMGVVTIAGQQFDMSILYNSDASNLGQCVWYARSRALELIYNSNMDDASKIRAMNAISGVAANGNGWYSNSYLNIFDKSSDSHLPMPGAIVSWSGGSNVCTPGCGHVAIVESVDYENETIIISEGYNSAGANGAPIWDNVRVRVSTYSFDSIRNYGPTYIFNGYVYILGSSE